MRADRLMVPGFLRSPLVRVAGVGVTLALIMALAAHIVNDHLLPAGDNIEGDMTLPYPTIVLYGVVLLAGVLTAGAIRGWVLSLLAQLALGLGVLLAAFWCGLAAIGDLAGSGISMCPPILSGPRSLDDHRGNVGQYFCVPSPLSDGIQFPLHLGIVILLLVAFILCVIGHWRHRRSLFPPRITRRPAMVRTASG